MWVLIAIQFTFYTGVYKDAKPIASYESHRECEIVRQRATALHPQNQWLCANKTAEGTVVIIQERYKSCL